MKVVFNSNLGTSEEYARIIAERLKVSCVSLKEFSYDDEIIFVSWVMLNEIKELKTLKENGADIVCVCSVGVFGEISSSPKFLLSNSEEEIDENKLKEFQEKAKEDEKKEISNLKEKNNMGEYEILFTLPGRFYIGKLSGMLKMIMKMCLSQMKKELKDGGDENDKKVFDLLENGIDLFDESATDKVIEFFGSEK